MEKISNNKSSSTDDSSNSTSNLIMLNNRVNNIMSILIVSLGVPGNLISMLIFYRLAKANKSSNMGLLYTIQCTIDVLVIVWVQLATRYQNSPFEFSISDLNEIACKLAMFLRRLFLAMSSWITVITAFDRFIFVFYEHRFLFMRRRAVTLGIISSTFALLAIIATPNLFYFIDDEQNCTSYFNILLSSNLISIVFRTYIPFGLMVYFNVNMIRKWSNHTKSTHLGASSTVSNRHKEKSFTLAVISCDVIFLITHFPLSI